MKANPATQTKSGKCKVHLYHVLQLVANKFLVLHALSSEVSCERDMVHDRHHIPFPPDVGRTATEC